MAGRTLFLFLVLVLVSVGCTPTQSNATTTDTPQSGPVLTLAAAPSPTPLPIIASPVGIAVSQSKGSRLAFYDLQGNLLGIRAFPSGSGNLHVSGLSSAGLDSLTVINIRQINQEVLVNAGEQDVLRVNGYLSGTAGVPGMPVVAFATYELIEDGRLRSQIYLGTPETLAAADPVFTSKGDLSAAPVPLVIVMESGLPVGLWYTTTPIGIGGDIIFSPTRDLFYLDLASGASMPYTAGEELYRPVFSPDTNWLAYTSDAGMNILDRQTRETWRFPNLPESDRGAGDAVFSPDNHYVAWKEAHGTRMSDTPDYYPILRIATIGEGPARDIYKAFFEGPTGDTIADVSPIVWLDADTLLVELYSESGISETWSIDLPSMMLYKFAEGRFVDFIYP